MARSTQGNNSKFPEFVEPELDKALRQLKNGRSVEKSGIVAEMLKHGGGVLKVILLELYNDVMTSDAPTPQQWKKTHITVLFKAGDPQVLQSWRPIAVILLLHKLFAQLLYNRLEPILDPQQSPDQAGFRNRYRTDGHLFAVAMTQETEQGWQVLLWIATLDFKEAFDTVSRELYGSPFQNRLSNHTTSTYRPGSTQEEQ